MKHRSSNITILLLPAVTNCDIVSKTTRQRQQKSQPQTIFFFTSNAATELDAALLNALHDANGVAITNLAIESSTNHDKETRTMDDIKIHHYDSNDDDESERTSPHGIKFWWRNEHNELELRSRKTSTM